MKLKPREKLQSFGAKYLNDKELLAILLGSGNSKNDVFKIAGKLLKLVDKLNHEICFKELTKINGLGPAKACLVLAAQEFFKRRIYNDGTKIKKTKDVLPLIQHLADRKQENFICITLNGAREVIASRIITVGLVNLCQVHPREVFAEAITDRASAIIVAHNHPSGDLTPSRADMNVTRLLKQSADILGIEFLDHVIFSKKGYYSICGEIY